LPQAINESEISVAPIFLQIIYHRSLPCLPNGFILDGRFGSQAASHEFSR
jgi:hypothetical protein